MSLNKEQFEVLKQLFNDLSEEQKQILLFINNERINIKSSCKIDNIFIKDELFKNQEKENKCPVCGSIHIVKNGKKDGIQRLICKDCNKTFGYTENTILKRTRLSIDTLSKYITCMLDKKSLRETAKICNISLSTSFSWRHKILDALQNMQNDVILNGIIESDETFTSISYKGNHKNSKTNFKLPRKSHKRGHSDTLRGLSQEKVCLSCSVNHDGLSIGKFSNLGKPNWIEINNIINNRIEEGSIFVTDSFKGYNKLSYNMNLNHITIPRNKHTNGVFNIQLINNYHRRLKELINRIFNGVATKYINNYIVYHNFVNFAKGDMEYKFNVLMNFIFTTTNVKHERVIV